MAGTTQNALNLANLHLQHGHHAEAKLLFTRALSGLHADDPDLLLGLAQAHFGLAEFHETLECLDTLKATHPKRTTPDGHLLYARALQEAGRDAGAIEEYEVLVRYYPGPEPACRLASMLRDRGEPDRAHELYLGVLRASKTAGRHYNTLHKDWVAVARKETQA